DQRRRGYQQDQSLRRRDRLHRPVQGGHLRGHSDADPRRHDRLGHAQFPDGAGDAHGQRPHLCRADEHAAGLRHPLRQAGRHRRPHRELERSVQVAGWRGADIVDRAERDRGLLVRTRRHEPLWQLHDGARVMLPILHRTSRVMTLGAVENDVNLASKMSNPKESLNAVFFNTAAKGASNISTPATRTGTTWLPGSSVFWRNSVTNTGATGSNGSPGGTGPTGGPGTGGTGGTGTNTFDSSAP